jgi:1-acyl-sn-glycerol-3-phosphate acyltransferase
MKEPYVPDVGIVYPEQPDAHMVPVNAVREITIDENYPFLDKSFKFNLKRNLIYLGIYTLVFFLCFVRFGIKIEGRKNLYKHRKLLKNGAMTISNHVQRWDFIFITLAVRFRKMYFPAWKEHLRGRDVGYIRSVGGIPIPEDIRTMKCFNRAFDEICAKKIWIHAYPESTRFDYFVPIRPFKKGVFTMAHRYNLPIVPIAISYRKSHFPFSVMNSLRSLTGKQKLPLITVRIGEPVLFDKNLDRKEAVQKIRKECHEAVIKLAGINNNPYPAEGD